MHKTVEYHQINTSNAIVSCHSNPLLNFHAHIYLSYQVLNINNTLTYRPALVTVWGHSEHSMT